MLAPPPAMRVLLALVAVLLVALAALAVVFWRFHRWYLGETEGLAYYGRTAAGRRAFKDELRARSGFVLAVLRVVLRVRPLRTFPSVVYEGVTGPPQCREGFPRAAAHRPVAGDVFVVTQMKCGTTWMQQVVYEVLMRGRGDLGDDGHRHLYALSPWIEASTSVSLTDAPRIGPHGARVIKTHLPTRLCPFGPEARYVYVTRDPVACFASIVDFLEMMGGPLTPGRADLLDWYCSDRMWWRSWPEHVDGWWRWSCERPNVLFVHFEAMLADLPRVVDDVARFLDVALTDDERARIVAKSGFTYMREHEERFEMMPPTASSVRGRGRFLKSGRGDRKDDVVAGDRARIVAFCRERLRGAAYPAARFYPELAP